MISLTDVHFRAVRTIALVVFSSAGFSQSLTTVDLEVASIKPHASRDTCTSVEVLPGGTIRVGCYTLEIILREALSVFPDQLQDIKGWMRSDSWDIVAKSSNPAGKSDDEIYHGLLLAIAEQRFHVKLRTQRKEMKGLVLTQLRDGKLGRDLHPTAGAPHSFDSGSGPILSAKNVSMAELAKWLKWPTGSRTEIQDATGLSGGYDFVLRWTPLHEEEISDPAMKQYPTIFSAVREQLGLKLGVTKVQGVSYVVESAQRPELN